MSCLQKRLYTLHTVESTGQWYALSAVIYDAWYCIVLHSIAGYCIVLHGIA